MMETKCGCGECEWVGYGWQSPLRHGAHGSHFYCPYCADRLNADGTVTPKREWIAEELLKTAERLRMRARAASLDLYAEALLFDAEGYELVAHSFAGDAEEETG